MGLVPMMVSLSLPRALAALGFCFCCCDAAWTKAHQAGQEDSCQLTDDTLGLDGAQLFAELSKKEINEVDLAGQTAAHVAASEGHYSCMKAFAMQGLNLDRLNKYGHAAIHIAAEQG